MECNCFFCDENRFSLNRQIGLYGSDWIVYEDENVFVTPDVSPIIKGHFLVVSKSHINSFGNGSIELFSSLQKAIDIMIERVFTHKDVLFFEHGAVRSHTAGGCIDHAHVHLIPLEKPIDVDAYLDEHKLLEKRKTKMTYNNIHNLAVSIQPYIAYGYCKNDIWVRNADWLPTQFVRMMVSSFYPCEYNWKVSCRTEYSKKIFEDTMKTAASLLEYKP